MTALKAPRSVFLNFPLGRQCGQPENPDMQKQILKDTLNLLTTATTPGEMLDLPYEWGESFDWQSYQKDMTEMLKEEEAPIQNWSPNK